MKMTEDRRRERTMKAVISEVPADILAWRKRTGADRWDEMWEGVLHMPPMPNREHQELEWAMETYPRLRWARPRKAKVYHNINIASPGGWPNDYRIPDLVLVTQSASTLIATSTLKERRMSSSRSAALVTRLMRSSVFMHALACRRYGSSTVIAKRSRSTACRLVTMSRGQWMLMGGCEAP
jgi:hypothetical protein